VYANPHTHTHTNTHSHNPAIKSQAIKALIEKFLMGLRGVSHLIGRETHTHTVNQHVCIYMLCGYLCVRTQWSVATFIATAPKC